MSTPMNPWMRHVHDTTLAEGATLRIADMLERFGKPPGKRLVHERLFDATQSGYFRKHGNGPDATYQPLTKRQKIPGGWPEERKELLRRVFPEMGGACLSLFPGVPRKRLYAMASTLGLKAPTRKKPPRPAEPEQAKPRPIPAASPNRVSSIWDMAGRCA